MASLVTLVLLAAGAMLVVLVIRLSRSQRASAELARDTELVLESAGQGILRIGPAGEIVFVNAAGAAMLGASVRELVGAPAHERFHHSHADGTPYPQSTCPINGSLADGRTRRISGERFWRPDGTSFPVEYTSAPLVDDGAVRGVVVGFSDITRRLRIEHQLRDAENRFRKAFEEAAIGMALVGLDGQWTRVNRALCEMLGYTREELLAISFQDVTHPDDLEADLGHVERLLAGETDTYRMEKRYLGADGRIIWAQLAVSLVRDAEGRPLHFISQVQDISERREIERRLVHMAEHDALTGLYNRRRFAQELERQVAHTERYGNPATLLMLDLDRFKQVNDSFGHAAGDGLLADVAVAIRERLRTTDIVARLGGDEFAIILPETAVEDGRTVAASLARTIEEAGVATRDGRSIGVTASIGVAPIDPARARTVHELLDEADVEMYGVKRG